MAFVALPEDLTLIPVTQMVEGEMDSHTLSVL